MKKKLLVLFSMLFICAVCLFGCGVSALSGGPSLDATVYGNGGYSVIKGNYIYFSNAYIDFNDIGEGQNKYDFNNSNKVYGIFRAKLNDNNLVELDDNGVPKGAELMVPQVGGYAYSGLYICGNYLYYTTPFTGDKEGQKVKGLVTFDRVNLDRTDHKVLYKMVSYSSECEYSINYIDGTTYITILDTNSNVILLSVKGKNVSSKTIACEVEEYAVNEQKNIVYNEDLADINNYVYYTKKDSNDYYSIYKKSMINDEAESVVVNSTTNTLKIVKVKNDRLYYLEDNILKSTSTQQNAITKVYTTQEIITDVTDEDANGIISYYILDDTFGTKIDRGILGVSYNGSTYSVYNFNTSSQFKFLNEKSITILHATGDKIYYKVEDDDALYCFNGMESNKIAEEFITSVSDEETAVYDFDNNNGYYFDTIDENNSIKYLHLVSLSGDGYLDDENNNIGHYIGVINANNMK